MFSQKSAGKGIGKALAEFSFAEAKRLGKSVSAVVSDAAAQKRAVRATSRTARPA